MVNKVYKVDEAVNTWQDTGTPAITLNNLAATTGMRQGAQLDLGAPGTARARRYRWRFWTQFAASLVVGEVVKIYLKTGDTNALDNDDGTGDIAVSNADKLKNVPQIGTLIVDEAVVDVEMSVGGVVLIDEEYVMPIIANETSGNLKATNDTAGFTLTPVPDELQ